MTTETKNTDAGQNTKTETETLSADEKRTLLNCEASIRNGLKAYQNVGRALTVIAQNRLYRATHSTFAKYAREKWDMTTARVAQLQAAYRIHELLTGAGFKTVPATESQCRPLSRIPQDEEMDARIIEAWQAVVDSKEKITAKLVDACVDKVLGIKKEKAEPGSDSKGTGAGAGTGKQDTDAEGGSASAELRAQLRDARRKIAYLESVLEAEKRAHQRTKAAGGIPKSDIAVELFKAGFRAMAKKYHPDHGGSDAKMRELNQLKGVLLD